MAETYVFKTVGDCPIHADVYAATKDDGRPHPVAMWIHGGALMIGARGLVGNYPVIERFLDAGFVLVSVDYRLAPETKVPQIIEDIQDAYRWVREEGPTLFGADPDRIAIGTPIDHGPPQCAHPG